MTKDQRMWIASSTPFVWLLYCGILYLLPISETDKTGMIGLGGTILGVFLLTLLSVDTY